eukprot:CAMPEP_0114495650 /NCGR_PEP_ID=MMETSP0109-20121206/5329_1 /TAXON_ID=29199 /ORGANISM="Chlorarachnion reptans, Strain CCCM449" /LENGTH=195 /DNA_ID=CAMNT_0001672829 /DNA_START=634 /DNA_END=1221 /DNA_ORIENTATION=+
MQLRPSWVLPLALVVVVIGFASVFPVRNSAGKVLGFSCCGTVDVPEWNSCAESLKTRHFANDEKMKANLDKLTNGLAGRTKRVLAMLVETMGARTDTKVRVAQSKLDKITRVAEKEKWGLDNDKDKKARETRTMARDTEDDLEEFRKRNKAFERSKTLRPQTEKEEEEKFRSILKKYEAEIEKLKLRIKAEKETV